VDFKRGGRSDAHRPLTIGTLRTHLTGAATGIVWQAVTAKAGELINADLTRQNVPGKYPPPLELVERNVTLVHLR
jgi:hypothetical protein